MSWQDKTVTIISCVPDCSELNKEVVYIRGKVVKFEEGKVGAK